MGVQGTNNALLDFIIQDCERRKKSFRWWVGEVWLVSFIFYHFRFNSVTERIRCLSARAPFEKWWHQHQLLGRYFRSCAGWAAESSLELNGRIKSSRRIYHSPTPRSVRDKRNVRTSLRGIFKQKVGLTVETFSNFSGYDIRVARPWMREPFLGELHKMLQNSGIFRAKLVY